MLGDRPNVRLMLATAASVVAVAISACSSGSSGVSTGSLFGGGKKQVDMPTERAMRVAATSARATQCGYNFDPTRLKTNYLAFETAQGANPDQIAKLDRTFEYTKGSVSKRMADPDEYCNEEQTAKIKSDLTRHMAGDFALTQRTEASLLDSLSGGSSNQPWDKQKAFCPNQTCY